MYIFGRDKVKVQTDHKPLESIIQKELHAAPKRLQRMLLRLQRYNLQVDYVKGKLMFLADTLSRAPQMDVSLCDLEEEVQSIDNGFGIPVGNARWEELRKASLVDPVLPYLNKVIREGWPSSKRKVQEHLLPYYDVRDQLTVEGSLIFKGHRVVVPQSLRKEFLAQTHSMAGHLGTGSSLCKAREVIYWPRIMTELRDYFTRCDVCFRHREHQRKEPLQPQSFGTRP